MTDCDKLKENFSDYLDGELPIEQRKQLEDHFNICPDCHETMRQIRIIQQSLKQLPQISTNPNFEQKLQQQIFQPHQKSNFIPSPFQNWKIPVMGSAIVLATVGFFLVFNDTSNKPEIPITNPVENYSPAAPQLPGGHKVDAPSSTPSTHTVSKPLQGSTVISDSLRSDSTRIDKKGVIRVGNK